MSKANSGPEHSIRQRVAIVVPQVSDPRFHRRAEAFLQAGYDVTVYAFDRGIYGCNTFPKGVNLVKLGSMAHKRYFARLLPLARAVRTLRVSERAAPTPSVVYAAGLDNAFLAWFTFAPVKRIVYEVADLRNASERPSLIGRFFQFMEDHLLRRCGLLAVTSPAFLEQFFVKRAPELAARAIVVENKLPSDLLKRLPRSRAAETQTPIRVGYIGRLRYERTLRPLIEGIADRPERYQLIIHGDGPLRKEVEMAAARYPNIEFHGPFRNPDDLPSVYGSADLCYVVYDNRDFNVRVALPNKLYECAYFGVPVAVADRTVLSGRVRSWNAGWVLEPREAGFVERFLDDLTPEEIDFAKRRASAVPTSKLVEDHGELLQRVAQLTSQRPWTGLRRCA